MTAAAAIVAALQVSNKIKDFGSYAGFAAVLGLAVLALLYFAQAREVKRLREWAGRAPERDAELQARVTAEAQQRATPAAAPAAKPVTAAATPAGQAVSAKPATPTPTPAAPAKPGVPATSTPSPQPGVTSPVTAAAAAAGAASASPAVPTAPPTTPPADPAKAAGNGSTDQPTQITPPPPPAPPRPAPRPGQPLRPPTPAPAVDESPHERSPLRMTLMIVGSVLAVAAIAVVLVTTVFSGSDNKAKPNTIGGVPATTTTGSPSAGSGDSGNKTTPVSRGDVTVAVLNGTTVPGLARGAATKLQSAGFKIGNVTNAPDQARSATLVTYQPGHQAEARVVARLIGVGADAVKPIDPSTQVVAGQEAFVVVTVGADQSR
jgi:hypothetical protein